jgi:hypothetical protein
MLGSLVKARSVGSFADRQPDHVRWLPRCCTLIHPQAVPAWFTLEGGARTAAMPGDSLYRGA